MKHNTRRPNFEALRELAAVIDGIPSERINLSSLVEFSPKGKPLKELQCGALCCAIGWWALHPKGKEMGYGIKEVHHYISGDSIDITIKGKLPEGIGDYGSLFNLSSAESCHLFGGSFKSPSTHKEEFRQRVCDLFDVYGEPVSRSYRYDHRPSISGT